MSNLNPVPSELSPNFRRWEKIWNTHVRIPLPWMFRFAPHRHWEGKQLGDSHGPDQFVDLTPSSYIMLEEVTTLAPGAHAAILDLGCNCGRHLNALWGRGFHNLHGVDVQHAALEHMKAVFPEMAVASDIRQGTFQEYLPKIGDRFFDVTFSHGATIELVPPIFPICQELARVTSDAIVLAISESGHYYPRLWEKEFLRAGFLLRKLLRPICTDESTSLLVFVRMVKV